ncbi:MAG: amino acid ABC transporter substrate-binding protein [Actinobacteria bacterium]|nr:amino acid ABC transporter substrate-binding protein [Actinomycetota bacterium]MCB8996619.1 amino acid ABC transporter substrate-binding protein [Actinomycetota bacterium]MCB9415062.1 amino acid ABC transporter substrate-binding protein [Actinomycetota bacterium]HRY10781.1 ABC transporter substrate-binding protein [Candidatus Nanopelagicales bacterium]
MRRSLLLSAALPAVAALALAGCASEADTSSSASATPSASVDCSPESLQTLTPGTLKVGTDTPAYPPYFEDDDPSNGKGFESAVAYAVAEELGFSQDQVTWVTVPFNKSYAPGAKDFDFDINQISITPKRQKAVDFSEGYYTVNQAVVALEDSPIANATTLAELQEAKLGAQVGTTSLDFITEDIQPTQEPMVYNDTNDAKSALEAGQIDGIVVDLPTAYYVTAVEFDNAKIVGQFPAQEGGEEFGLLMAKGSPLVTCVNQALTSLKDSGELQQIQDEWLVGKDAPYFTE